VAETIEYEQFDQPGHADGADGALADTISDADLSRLSDIPMELSVEIGRTHMTVGETLDLRVGSVVALERLAGETADLLVNGTAIARGEVVVIDEQYGLRITEILDAHGDPASAGAGVGAAVPRAADGAEAGVDAGAGAASAGAGGAAARREPVAAGADAAKADAAGAAAEADGGGDGAGGEAG